jgi:hypothetical protein
MQRKIFEVLHLQHCMSAIQTLLKSHADVSCKDGVRHAVGSPFRKSRGHHVKPPISSKRLDYEAVWLAMRYMSRANLHGSLHVEGVLPS